MKRKPKLDDSVVDRIIARLDAGELSILANRTDSTAAPTRGDITITICDRTSVKAVVIEQPTWTVEEVWRLVAQLVKKVDASG